MRVYVDELPNGCENCPCRQDVVLEKERLKWVECNIQDINKTHTENIDGLTVKVIDCPLELIVEHDKEKDHRIAVLERALELACSKIGIVPIITDENIDAFYRKHKEATMDDYFIDQAEKELKSD